MKGEQEITMSEGETTIRKYESGIGMKSKDKRAPLKGMTSKIVCETVT